MRRRIKKAAFAAASDLSSAPRSAAPLHSIFFDTLSPRLSLPDTLRLRHSPTPTLSDSSPQGHFPWPCPPSASVHAVTAYPIAAFTLLDGNRFTMAMSSCQGSRIMCLESRIRPWKGMSLAMQSSTHIRIACPRPSFDCYRPSWSGERPYAWTDRERMWVH